MKKGTSLRKYKVCDECFSIGIRYVDCRCSYDKYNTIELEFTICDCCGNVIDDGNPPETEFNLKQLKKLSEKKL